MTTIAFKDGIMSSDTMYSQDGIYSYDAPKIIVNDKFVVAHCGDAGDVENFLKFLSDGTENNSKDSGFIVWDFENERAFYNSFGKANVEIINNKFADGSGYAVALGAMEHGATAIEAVEIAIKLDNSSGGRVIAYDCFNKKWIKGF